MNRNEGIQSRLVSGLFWILLLNLLIKPLWILGIEVGAQNAVGAAEYGLYTELFNLAYIFNIVLDLGITNFNTRNIARHPQLISKHFARLLCIKVLLLGFYLVATFTVGLISGYHSRQFQLLALLCFNQFLNSLILYLRSNFEGLLMFKWDSVVSILDRVIMIVICGWMLWGPQHGAESGFTIFHLAGAQTVAYVITACTALTVTAAKVHRTGMTGISAMLKSRFTKPFVIAILKQSAPFALLVLLMASYNRVDPLMLAWLLPEGNYASLNGGHFQAGIYAGAFRLLDALTMVAYLVSVPLLPVFARLTRTANEDTSDRQALAATTRMITSLMLVFSISAALVCSVQGRHLMGLLFRQNNMEYTSVFVPLVYGIIPISLTYVFGTLLTAAGRMRQLNILAATSLVLNIVVNLICIPQWGAVGSAYASLTAQSFMAVSQTIVALHLFKLRPGWSLILRMLIFTVAMTAYALLMSSQPWWAAIGGAVIVGLLIAVILKLIDIKMLTSLLLQHNQQQADI